MYFVVRTDVTSDSGKQRMMGLFDDDKTAWEFIDLLKQDHAGDFKVFGNAVEISRSK